MLTDFILIFTEYTKNQDFSRKCLLFRRLVLIFVLLSPFKENIVDYVFLQLYLLIHSPSKIIRLCHPLCSRLKIKYEPRVDGCVEISNAACQSEYGQYIEVLIT